MITGVVGDVVHIRDIENDSGQTPVLGGMVRKFTVEEVEQLYLSAPYNVPSWAVVNAQVISRSLTRHRPQTITQIDALIGTIWLHDAAMSRDAAHSLRTFEQIWRLAPALPACIRLLGRVRNRGSGRLFTVTQIHAETFEINVRADGPRLNIVETFGRCDVFDIDLSPLWEDPAATSRPPSWVIPNRCVFDYVDDTLYKVVYLYADLLSLAPVRSDDTLGPEVIRKPSTMDFSTMEPSDYVPKPQERRARTRFERDFDV